jgi:tetratricopeptide (TPR) repeat protein
LLARKNGYLSLAFLSGFVSILVTNFFGFSVVPIALQFFLFPAMAISLEQKSKRIGKQEIAKISKPQTSAIIILCFLTFLTLYSLAKYWSADIFYARGKLENDRGNYKTGREKLEKAIKLSPKEAIYWDEKSQSSTGLALALFETDDNELANDFMLVAIAESDKAIALSPRNINLRRSRGNLFIKLSTFDSVYLFSAREVITDAIELAPTDAKLHYNLGLTHARIGELDAAIETLQRTIELKPNYRNARLALGLLYADQGETKKARAEFEYILEKIDPEDELVRQQLEEL